MRHRIQTVFKIGFAIFIGLAPLTSVAQSKAPTKKPDNTPARRDQARPQKLPQKTTPTKRTFLDFSKDDTTVISRPLNPLDRALNKSIVDVQTASTPTQIRSRRIVPAPQGDLSEPITSYAATPVATPQSPKQAPRPIVTQIETKASPAPTATPSLPAPQVLPLQAVAKPSTPPSPPAPALEPMDEFVKPVEPIRSVVPPVAFKESPPLSPETTPETAPVTAPMTVVTTMTATTTTTSESLEREGFIKSIDEQTMAFVRTGFYTANYKKFDDRMNNGASVLGIGVARGAETSWGSFEARAAFDMYHAMDQSVTVDNIRMLSVRTELAYWLSRSRVKPGVSLGLGWADYSIRSYRSVSGANEEEITLRTHAKGRAFSVIPATSLRIELSKGLVVDVQTEFMALLGGSSPDAAQGLGVNVGLGWIF